MTAGLLPGGRTLAALLPSAFLALSLQVSAQGSPAPQAPSAPSAETVKPEREAVGKVLFIGDSMTGWLAERFNAYGRIDGFEVATVVWDGSTIRKWAASPRLAELVREQDPDVVFISLGMNELFERNPARTLGPAMADIIADMGDTPFVWIGPPSWPGHKEGQVLVDWLESVVGKDRFFNSFGLELPRQSRSNPHPSRAGIVKWIDALVEWLPEDTEICFPRLDAPAPDAMSRGKVFVYKRMKESL